MEILKVLICGIGAVGSIYANKISNYDNENLRILVDKNRLEKYQKQPKIFNGKELKLNYILPENTDFKADLIIIATKYDGLEDAAENIKNFIKEDTIILSLLNGVTSEKILSDKYGKNHIQYSYFIGHSAMRNGNIINHDGVGHIVFSGDKCLKDFFDKANIDYKISNDMYRALWLKFMLNVSSNQTSAILKLNFGQMQNNPKCRKFLKHIMEEVVQVAKAEGVNNTETLIDEAFMSFDSMVQNGKTSMLQDVEAKRKTEVEMFAATVIELGKKHNIPTPYNIVLEEMIETIEAGYIL